MLEIYLFLQQSNPCMLDREAMQIIMRSKQEWTVKLNGETKTARMCRKVTVLMSESFI